MYKIIKRFFDIFISLIGITILIPLFIIISILIKIDSKGPIFFVQDRIGKNGKVFKMYKFRSMKVDSEKLGVYESKNDNRVTRVGKVIRKLSIDELPQFINILKGDMSIIGPRPTLTYHPWKYEEYSEFQKQRFKVRPGVTGWAQVNGRKDVEWNRRIELDVYYVNNLSFILDFKIFFMTIWKVLTNKDNVNRGETVVQNNIKLMYITNDPKIAKIAESNGVDWIFVDLEIKGKIERQGHLDTVISKHKIEDIFPIKKELSKSKLLVRVNPINEESELEIDRVINNGADIVMLPFFKTKKEVEKFIAYVSNRAQTCLLLETPEAVENLDEILEVNGIDYIHIGLNDLHLGYKRKFMFELLADGTVDAIIEKIKSANIEYGFGGIAQLYHGDLPAEKILTEHYRLGSTMAILSRSFCNTNIVKDYDQINDIFSKGIKEIRDYEKQLQSKDDLYFRENREKVNKLVSEIIRR